MEEDIQNYTNCHVSWDTLYLKNDVYLEGIPKKMVHFDPFFILYPALMRSLEHMGPDSENCQKGLLRLKEFSLCHKF